MWYWNQANFESLSHIAAALREDQRLVLLAEYCQCRQAGLRSQAFAALDKFLDRCAKCGREESREICQRVLEMQARLPEAHQFMSHPLLTRLIFPVLASWHKEEPENRIATRWLGLLRSDSGLLERALAVDPSDLPVRRRLVDMCLGDVDYATHHLAEDLFLGDIADARQSIESARYLLESCTQPESVADLSAELRYFESMVDDWVAFSSSGATGFPSWCASRARSYGWPSVHEY